MALETKRWLILLVGVVANLCQGMAYTSSVFMLPLGEALTRPKEAWSGEWGFIFAMCLAFLPLGMILSGGLADFGRTRFAVGAGALLFGCGLILAGFGGSVAWMAVTLGFMTSVGSGFAYGAVIGAMVRWFPDRRGLASGLAVAAVGVGPIVLAPLASACIDAYGVLNMFKILGAACLAAMGLAALYVQNPPAGYRPAGWTPPAPPAPEAAGAGDPDWRRILGRLLFWLMYAAYAAGAFAGVLVSSLASPIAVELAGFSRGNAHVAVMLFAFSNCGGRVLWGFLSDRLGRVFMLGAAFVVTAASMFILYGHASRPALFALCLMAAGLCYGGVFGTFPSLCADSFGVKNAAMNFAALFTSFSLVALLAPQVAAFYRDGGPAEYPKAFLVAGCVAACGLFLTILIARERRYGR